MANPLQIYVDDTSPSITYYPFADTFGPPNLNAGWNPYYTGSGYAAYQGQTGQGTSLHRTSLDGASFSIQWNGTGIQLFGNASQASYNLTLDGTPVQANSSSPGGGILADFFGLTEANHTVTLTVHTTPPPSPDTFVDFDQALITSGSEQNNSNSTLTTITMNDTDVSFLGQWSFEPATSENGQDIAFHYSISAGDRAQITFQGPTVSLTGFVSDVSGKYSVTLDNQTTSLSGHSSFLNMDTLLFYATGLDDRQHQLMVQNMEDRVLALKVGGFSHTAVQNDAVPTPSTANSTSNRGVIAGITVACVLSFIFLALVFGYFLVYRPRARRRGHDWKAQRSYEKEVEAGGGIMDISAEPEDKDGRRGSTGTSLRFTGLRYGLGNQQNQSEVFSIDSRESSKKGHRDQWEAHTIDLPSLSPQRSRSTPVPSARLPRSTRSSTGTRRAHSRMESGARLIGDQDTHDSDNNDGPNELEYNCAELSLSPRTSEAHFVSRTRTLARSKDRDIRPSREAPHLEESPFAVDFIGRMGSASNDVTTSQLSQQAAPVGKPEQDPERHRDSQDESRLPQVRPAPTTGLVWTPRLSFLDFSTPTFSSDPDIASGLSNPSERERSRWSATTAPSVGASALRTEPPSASHASVTFNLPLAPSRPQGPRRLSVSAPGSPRRHQSFSTDQIRPRHASVPSTLEPTDSSSDYHIENISPTDSVPMTVSDIHFRRNDSEAGSRRTSTASQLIPPLPRLPSNLQPWPESPPTPPTPFIVQKLRGMATSTSLSPTPDPSPARDIHQPTPESPGSAHREVARPSTPFMQRVFGIGTAALSPRHNRNFSQDAAKPSLDSSRS